MSSSEVHRLARKCKMAVQNGNQNWLFVVNLGNSIIGVSVLAMPFCFKQCGIILGMLVLLLCTWLTLASCQLLVKAGIVSHRRSYEFLAYHTYGAAGKFTVEIGMIGMQLGTLIAQIVVIGDLGPPILNKFLGIENSSQLRMYLIMILCLFVGLPLGLMKDLHSVSRVSTVCVTFYALFTSYILWMSSESLWSGAWYTHVNFWRLQGVPQCLPILSFSFGCQTQLFILYDALPEPSLHAIKSIIHSAVNLCAVTYLMVGFFGYITFYQVEIPGDIITVFPSTLATQLIKLGFVMSIAITFPIIIFPCRASIYTLLFQKDFVDKYDECGVGDGSKSKMDDMTSTYIPEHLFKAITVGIVVCSMTVGILIPNVEFILGLNGAITGTLICYIFPALFFLRVMSSKAEGKRIAQLVLVLGVSILLVSTFTTLYTQDKGHVHPSGTDNQNQPLDRVTNQPQAVNNNVGAEKHETDRPKVQDGGGAKADKGKRVEPPIPDAPGPEVKEDVTKRKIDDTGNVKQTVDTDKKALVDQLQIDDDKDGKEDSDKNGEAQAPIEKDVTKLGEKNSANIGEKDSAKQEEKESVKREEKLLAALEEQRREQEKLLQEQKALLKELKDHKEHDHEKPKSGGDQQVAQGVQQQDMQQQGANGVQAGGVQQVNARQVPAVVPQAQLVNQDQGLMQQQQQQQPVVQGQKNFVPVEGNVQQQVNAQAQANMQQVYVPAGGNIQQPVLGNAYQQVSIPVQGNFQQQVGQLPAGANPQQSVDGNLQHQVNIQQQPAIAPVQQQPVNHPAQDSQQQQVSIPANSNFQPQANVQQQQANHISVQQQQQAVNVNVPVQQQPVVPIQGNMQESQGTGQQGVGQGGVGGVQGVADRARQGVPPAVDQNQQAERQNTGQENIQPQHVAQAGQEGDKQRDLLRKKRDAPEEPPPSVQDSDLKQEMRRKLKSSSDLRDDSVENLLDMMYADNGLNSLKQHVVLRSLKAKDGG